MKKKIITIISITLLALSGSAYSQEPDSVIMEEEDNVENSDIDTTEKGLKISGLIRNDAFILNTNDGTKFADILETRLILDRKTEEWNFYADGRFFMNYGEQTKTGTELEAKLMRAFARYFSPIGDFTLGKTYVNLGNAGLFNPFETDKSVKITDVNYEKEGLLALEYEFPIGEVSGGKLYGGTSNIEISSGIYDPIYMGGLSLYTNAMSFDFGAIAMRNDTDKNLGGACFKGDLIVGIQGAYACHFDDSMEYTNSEANFGIDYSFFTGKLIFSLLFYFNQAGETDSSMYGDPAAIDSYFSSRYYIYGIVTYMHDEFLSANISNFTNLIDGSTILMPSLNITIANGLTMTLMVSFITGKGNDEFSRDQYGNFTSMIRVEGKF